MYQTESYCFSYINVNEQNKTQIFLSMRLFSQVIFRILSESSLKIYSLLLLCGTNKELLIAQFTYNILNLIHGYFALYSSLFLLNSTSGNLKI